MADLAGAYADARRRLQQLAAGLDDAGLMAPVPACPGWTVRDIVAHLVGVAEEFVSGTYFAGSADAWSDAGLAAQRDQWTGRQVRSRRDRPVSAMLAEWTSAAAALEPILAGTVSRPPGSPAWLPSAPVADLAAHLHDVRGALGLAGDRDAAATGLGLRIYARWLGERLDQAGRPALLLRAGKREWMEGSGRPAVALAAEPFELFRAISGRRSVEQVRALAWGSDPEPFIGVLSPYPMPAAPLVE
jgi:uncharacterized protein (TIGR03083 family)